MPRRLEYYVPVAVPIQPEAFSHEILRVSDELRRELGGEEEAKRLAVAGRVEITTMLRSEWGCGVEVIVVIKDAPLAAM